MKKSVMLLILGCLASLGATAQDDLYFVPSKDTKAVERAPATIVERPVYYRGSSRSVDDYNRRGAFASRYQTIGKDSLGNDIIRFEAGNGRYPDSVYVDTTFSAGAYQYGAGEDDYIYSRRMNRFDDYYWNDPWLFRGYYPWYDSWYAPWYYGYGYGYPFYGYYGWGYPYGYWGRPYGYWGGYYGWGWGGYYGWGYPYWGYPYYGGGYYVSRNGYSGTRNHSYGSVIGGRNSDRNMTGSTFGGTRRGTFTSGRNASDTRRYDNSRRSGSNDSRFGGSRANTNNTPSRSYTPTPSRSSGNFGNSNSSGFGGSNHSGGSFGGGHSGGSRSGGGGHFGGRR